MKRKWLTLLLSACALGSLSLGLASCDSANVGMGNSTQLEKDYSHCGNEFVYTEYVKNEQTNKVLALTYKSCPCENAKVVTLSAEEHTHVFDQEVVSEKYLEEESTSQTKALYLKSCVCGEEGTETFEFDGILYELNDEENAYTVVGYESTYGRAAIPTTYKGLPVTRIANGAFAGCGFILRASIPNSVTVVEENAFWGCHELRGVTVAESVTSIGKNAFYGKKLHTIEVHENNPAYQSIDGNLYTKDGKTLIQYAIGKEGTSFTVPEGVTAISDNAFLNADVLTTVTIPDSVTSIGKNAFRHCSLLTDIRLPSSLTAISAHAFDGCKQLRAIAIPDTVTAIDEFAFYCCSNLNTLSIPDNTTSIGKEAFYNCNSLTALTIGSNVTSIGKKAFFNCYKLVEVCNKSSLDIALYQDTHGYVSYYAMNVYTPNEGASKLTTDSNGYVIYTHNTDKYLISYVGTETELTLPTTVTKIYKNAFRAYTQLTSVVIPGNVTDVGEYAFANCSNLTTLTLNEGNALIDNYAFYYCTKLTNLTLPNSMVSLGNNAFYYCRNLESIDLGGLRKIGENCFYYCTALTEIFISSTVQYIGASSFYNCTKLTIYCEVDTKPTGWSIYWNNGENHVVWGYTAD